MNGSRDVSSRTLLIIGVHLEEVAFGKRVAEGLEEQGVHVFCVEHGLSRDGHRYSSFYREAFLRELYLQIHQQVQGKFLLVIDLHAGIHEEGPAADIYCKEVRLLDALCGIWKATGSDPYRLTSREIRLFQIVRNSTKRGDVLKTGYPVCRSFIPETVWQGSRYLYVGLETYLRKPGEGSPEDWQFTRQIISFIHKAYSVWRNTNDTQ